MEKIKSWSEQISTFEKLKLNEAQQLYVKALETDDEKLKKLYIDKIILGTLYVISNYVERNNLIIFQNSKYDVDDMLSAFTEIWIRKINNGDLLNVNHFSYMFTPNFFSEVYNNLAGSEIIVHEHFGIPAEIFVELFYLYTQFKNTGKDFNFEDLVASLDNNYYSCRLLKFSYGYLLNIFEKMYISLNFDKNDNLELTKNKIIDFFKLIVNNGMFESLSYNMEAEDMETEIVDKMFYKSFMCDVDAILTNDRERGVIYKRFGLDADNSKSVAEVAKYYNMTFGQTKQIEARAIRKLIGSSKIKKYKYNRGN